MDEKVLWTNLTQQEISEKLAEKYQIYVSTQIVRKLLKKHNYRRRKAQKKQTMKTAKNRNEQFENIARIKSEYETSGNPIISMDTKKKRTLATIIGMVTCILKK
jgi:rRNA-processing protein FCF1